MKKLLPKKINLYIAKNFLIRFLQIFLAFALLIFFVNLLEAMDKGSSSDTPFLIVVAMAFLQIPDFLNDIAPSMVLFAAIITFFFLSLKSEITIIRSCGFSLWSIVQPVAISAFLLGVFWITIFGPISILMARQFDNLEGRYIRNELRAVAITINGVWLKQQSLEKPGEELVIQARTVYRENTELDNVAVWFFDVNGRFYKKLDAKNMLLQEDRWLLSDIILNDAESLNLKLNNYTIPTNLKPDFVMDKIVSNFQNVKLFSLFELPKLISSLELAGFQSVKFKVYFHSLLAKPILFLSMVLIACYFGINNFRDRMAILTLFIGIICGLGLYISLSIINALGSSHLIPIFASTWVITFICFAIGVLLIYKKEAA